MGSKLVPFVLLFAAAVGGLLWMLFGEEEQKKARPAGPVEAAEAPEGREAEQLAELDETLDGGGEEQRSEVVVPEAPSMEAPAAAAKAAGGLRGQVLSEAGVPVPGARVAASNSTFMGMDFFNLRDVDFVQAELTVTDAEGRFSITGLDAGAVSVKVQAPGFAAFSSSGLRLPPGEMPMELDPFVLDVGAILEGHVVNASGGPVAGAELYSMDRGGSSEGFFMGNGRRLVSTSEADGSFRIDVLACGPYTIQVDSSEHPRGSFEGLAEKPGFVVSGLVFQLELGSSISGRVVDLPESGARGLAIRAARGGSGSFMFMGAGRSVDLDADGSFEVQGLAPGEEYQLQLRSASDSRPGFGTRSRSAPVAARGGNTGVQVAYQTAAVLLFQVVDRETGQPLTKFTVGAGTEWTRLVRNEQGKTKKLYPDGQVVIDDLRPRPGQSVNYEVEAVGYSTVNGDVEMLAGELIDQGIVYMDPVPVVRVTVLDRKTGEPVENARVTLVKSPDPSSGGRIEHRITIGEESDGETFFGGADSTSALTDENGLANLTSFEGATCDIKVRADGFAEEKIERLFLPEGAIVEETMKLSRGGAVVITVLDSAGAPLSGTKVSHRSPSDAPQGGSMNQTFNFGGGGGDDITDAKGRVRFANLEPGEHTFKIDESSAGGGFMSAGMAIVMTGAGGAGDEWSPAMVVEGEEALLTLHAKPTGALTGRVTEAGVDLVGATVSIKEKRERQNGMPNFEFPGMGGGNSARTDGKGGYVLEGMKVGDYELTITHPTRRMPAKFDVRIREGENDLDAELTVSLIEGRVTDYEGEPVVGARVEVERYTPASSGPQRAMFRVLMENNSGDVFMSSGLGGGAGPVTTDADGRYSLRGVLPDVDLVVKVSGKGYRPGTSEPVLVGPNQIERGVDLELFAGGGIVVEGFQASGAEAGFCMVIARYEGEEEGVEPKTSMLQSGTCSLDGLTPGPWRVTMQPMGPGGGGDGSVEGLVEVVAGKEAPLSLHLPN